MLLNLVHGDARLLATDLERTLLPADLEAFEQRIESDRSTVTDLLATGRLLVEVAERLVCRLYGLPPELEHEVVQHAVARAARDDGQAGG